MSKPFEADTGLENPEDISRKIWRNYKLSIMLGAVGLALSASILGVYKTSTSNAHPDIVLTQPSSVHASEQLVEIYEESP